MKRILALMLAVSVLLCFGVVAFATEETGFDVATEMTGAAQTIADNVLDTIAGVLPVALTVLGATVAIYFGIRFVRRIIGK